MTCSMERRVRKESGDMFGKWNGNANTTHRRSPYSISVNRRSPGSGSKPGERQVNVKNGRMEETAAVRVPRAPVSSHPITRCVDALRDRRGEVSPRAPDKHPEHQRDEGQEIGGNGNLQVGECHRLCAESSPQE